MIAGHGYRFPELRPQPLAGAARGEVVGVAGDPDLLQPVAMRQRKQQPAGALRVMTAARAGKT